MISEGYEKAIFASPLSERFAIESDHEGATVRVLTKEFDLLCDLRRAAKIVKEVVRSRETLFKVVERRQLRGAVVIEATGLGSQVMTLYQVTQEEMELYFPKHGFNPFVDLLFRARKDKPSDVDVNDDWKRARGEEAVRMAGQLNEFVKHLRKKADEREFKIVLERFRRRCDKNTRSMKAYISAIFKNKGARHLVIRLDLGYAMDDSWVAARPTSVTLRQAKQDLAKFQRYLRGNWPVTGFAARLEYGLLRGYHFHTLIFLNGDVVQQDVVIGKILGDRWRDAICEGQGRYWNCNAQEYAVRGVGMIHYADGDKRVALVEKVAAYLTKSDFWMRFAPGGRTLFKGLMPAAPPKRGRPRAQDVD